MRTTGANFIVDRSCLDTGQKRASRKKSIAFRSTEKNMLMSKHSVLIVCGVYPVKRWVREALG